jgi:hypothetical protein
MQLIAKSMHSIRVFQQTLPYDLSIVPEIQAMLVAIAKAPAFSDEELYKISLQNEPRER